MIIIFIFGIILGSLPVAYHYYRSTELRRRYRELAREIDLLKGRGSEFVANVSHELKTPLTSIKGYTETLRSGAFKDPEKSMMFLERIEQNTERLILLINDIMDLSRIESPNVHLEIEAVDVDEVLEEIRQDFAHKLLSRNQKLVFDNGLRTIQADRRLFEQCLSNLIENAHRYCQEGALIEVHSSEVNEDNENWWKFDITDNGPGINAEDLPRIFERFYRVDKSRNRLLGGTGLGLAIVKHIIMSHGGAVKVKSEQGRGTEFSLYFPKSPLNRMLTG